MMIDRIHPASLFRLFPDFSCVPVFQAAMVRWIMIQYSQVAENWIHVKAVRVFVESVLRYGLPPHFVATLINVCCLPSIQPIRVFIGRRRIREEGNHGLIIILVVSHTPCVFISPITSTAEEGQGTTAPQSAPQTLSPSGFRRQCRR